MMRTVTTVAAATAAAVTCMATPATAGISNSPNAFSLVLQCPGGAVTGTTAGGAALLLDGGGVAVLQGLSTASGEVVTKDNPGLTRNGRLVRCTYDSPRLGPNAVASVFFPA